MDWNETRPRDKCKKKGRRASEKFPKGPAPAKLCSSETRRSVLRRREVLPLDPGELHLEHAAFVRMKKIIALRDAAGIGRTHGALLPLRRPLSATVLVACIDDVDTVLNPVFDTGWTCWN